MSRSHDYYCPRCRVWFSPFVMKACSCGHPGVYDPSDDEVEAMEAASGS